MASFQLPDQATVDTPFGGESGFGSAYQQAYKQAQGLHADSGQTEQDIVNRLNTLGNQFTNLFTSLVGRAPTSDEQNQFFNENAGGIITGIPTGRIEDQPTNARNQVAQYISDTFQGAAKNQAQTLADQAQAKGLQAITGSGGVEDQLNAYASKLMDQLRPQLITSLASQGLLHSGASDEAFAGALKDLGTQNTGFIQSALLQNALNPTQLANSFAGGLVPGLVGAGENALSSNLANETANLDQIRQANQMAYENSLLQGNQPSLLQRLGRGFVTNFGESAGTGFGNTFSNLGTAGFNAMLPSGSALPMG